MCFRSRLLEDASPHHYLPIGGIHVDCTVYESLSVAGAKSKFDEQADPHSAYSAHLGVVQIFKTKSLKY